MLTDIRALADQFLIAFPNINTSLRCSLRISPVRTRRVRCEAAERPVLLFQTRVCVLAVGGNGQFKRLVTRGCFWSTGRTVPASGATYSESGAHVFCPVKGQRLV